MSYQMLYIIFASGKKVIKTDNPVTLVYQTRTKMRTYKARTATYQGFLHPSIIYIIFSFVKQNKRLVPFLQTLNTILLLIFAGMIVNPTNK